MWCLIVSIPDLALFLTLILKGNFPFLDGNVPSFLSMVYTFCNLFVLQEYVLMLMLGPDVVSMVGPSGFHCWISFTPLCCCMYC